LGSSGEHFRFYAWLTNNSYLYFRSYAGAADYEWNYQDATLYFNSREELEAARRKIIATLDSK
jgi:hypothetical protein